MNIIWDIVNLWVTNWFLVMTETSALDERTRTSNTAMFYFSVQFNLTDFVVGKCIHAWFALLSLIMTLTSIMVTFASLIFNYLRQNIWLSLQDFAINLKQRNLILRITHILIFRARFC